MSKKNNKILVTGGSGMVGKYLKKIMPDSHYISSKDYDLTSEKDEGVALYLGEGVQL